jgi:hypothetical protein
VVFFSTQDRSQYSERLHRSDWWLHGKFFV